MKILLFCYIIMNWESNDSFFYALKVSRTAPVTTGLLIIEFLPDPRGAGLHETFQILPFITVWSWKAEMFYSLLFYLIFIGSRTVQYLDTRRYITLLEEKNGFVGCTHTLPDETPSIGLIHLPDKVTITFEPMQWCNLVVLSKLKCLIAGICSLFHDWKHHL